VWDVQYEGVAFPLLGVVGMPMRGYTAYLALRGLESMDPDELLRQSTLCVELFHKAMNLDWGSQAVMLAAAMVERADGHTINMVKTQKPPVHGMYAFEVPVLVDHGRRQVFAYEKSGLRGAQAYPAARDVIQKYLQF
jgi:hypothetical protein